MWIDDSDVENDHDTPTEPADILPQPLRLLIVFLLMWQYLFHVAGISILIVFTQLSMLIIITCTF